MPEIMGTQLMIVSLVITTSTMLKPQNDGVDGDILLRHTVSWSKFAITESFIFESTR